MDDLHFSIPLEWMIWGYHYFRNHHIFFLWPHPDHIRTTHIHLGSVSTADALTTMHHFLNKSWSSWNNGFGISTISYYIYIVLEHMKYLYIIKNLIAYHTESYIIYHRLSISTSFQGFSPAGEAHLEPKP